MDRTWCIKGKLRNKVGGAVVAGRRDGAEGAITAIHALFLKHEMIPANRGVHGRAYAAGDIVHDPEALTSARKLGKRLLELAAVLGLERNLGVYLKWATPATQRQPGCRVLGIRDWVLVRRSGFRVQGLTSNEQPGTSNISCFSGQKTWE